MTGSQRATTVITTRFGHRFTLDQTHAHDGRPLLSGSSVLTIAGIANTPPVAVSLDTDELRAVLATLLAALDAPPLADRVTR